MERVNAATAVAKQKIMVSATLRLAPDSLTPCGVLASGIIYSYICVEFCLRTFG